MRTGRRRLATLAACLLFLAWGAHLEARAANDDPVLEGDPIDPVTQRAAEILPGRPWFQPGPDGELGTDDDVVDFSTIGDVDLVLRTVTGVQDDVPIPPTAPGRPGGPPIAVVGPAGTGTPVPFSLFSSDGEASPPGGNPSVSPVLDQNIALVTAFADLDRDGFLGVTRLDGNAADDCLEEFELDTVGRRYALFEGAVASGALRISLAGPSGAEPTLLVGSAAYAGPTRPDFFGGSVPDGPALLTALPFLPRTDPEDVFGGGTPEPASPEGLVGAEIENHFTPDPEDIYGEVFTLAIDGSEVSVDAALARSGPASTFGLVEPADASHCGEEPAPVLRPGLDASGEPILYRRLSTVALESEHLTRVVPLDALGNITAPLHPTSIQLSSTLGLSIVSPNEDQDPTVERILVVDALGSPVVLSGRGDLAIEVVPEPRALLGMLTALLLALILSRRRGPPGRQRAG